MAISGPRQMLRGGGTDNPLLECRSSPSVPAPNLRWRLIEAPEGNGAKEEEEEVGEELVEAAEHVVEEEDNGGLVAISWLTVPSGGVNWGHQVYRGREMGRGERTGKGESERARRGVIGI